MSEQRISYGHCQRCKCELIDENEELIRYCEQCQEELIEQSNDRRDWDHWHNED